MEDGRNLAERALGGSRIKSVDIDKVHSAGAKGFSAAEGLAYVEAWFELIEHQNERVFTRFCQDVALAFLVVTQQHVAAILFFAHSRVKLRGALRVTGDAENLTEALLVIALLASII